MVNPAAVRTAQTTCTCGFVSKKTTPGLAAHALRLHSCDRWTRLTEANQRGQERAAKVDRTPKACTHKRVTHEHGTHACYVLDQCRCLPCSKANSAYEHHRQRQTAYGRWQPYVDAAPVLAHIEQLRAQGMGWKRIADLAGYSSGAMSKLLYSIDGRTPTQKIRPDKAARLLAVQPDLAAGALIDATGTWRRLEALVAIGWPQSTLATRLGLTRALQFDRQYVTAGNAAKVATLYAELADTPGPSQRARNDAKRKGYLPPLWWDDDTIDDPTHNPSTVEANLHWSDVDQVAVDLACRGYDPGRPLTRAERITACLTLFDAGLDHGQIADRTGINREIVGRYIREHGQQVAC